MVANAAQQQQIQRIRQNFSDIISTIKEMNETDAKILSTLKRRR